MNLINNADEKITELLLEKSTRAYYLALCECVNKKYETVFTSNMQNYVTRLGLAVSEVITDISIGPHTFLGSIDFLCNKILKNKELYAHLRAMDVNDQANNGKHSIENISINIDECLHQYNRLIKSLMASLKLPSLKMCYLNNKVKSNFKDDNLFDEAKSHKYGMVANCKYELKLSPLYKIDPYRKAVTTKLTIFWKENYPDHILKVSIINPINNKVIASKDKIDIAEAGSEEFILNLKENDIQGRVLKVQVNIEMQVAVYETEHYTTGHLWWKEYNSYQRFDSFKDASKTTETLSQLLSKEID